jgi:hypothetical protein
MTSLENSMPPSRATPPSSEVGGSGHHRIVITHDASYLAHQLLWLQTATSIVVVRRKSMCRSPMAWALKIQERHDDLYWFGFLSPTSSSIVFFVLSSIQIDDYNNGDREFGGGSLDAILWLFDVLLPQ